MFASFFPSLTLSWWDVIISLMAASGAAVIFVGLLLEEDEEKDTFLSLDDFRVARSRAAWGRKLVMYGVLWEVITAFSIAAYDCWEINKNNPMNQPASEIEAIAVIDVDQTNTFPALDFSVLSETSLELLGTNIYTDSYFGLIPKTFPREFTHRTFRPLSVTFVGFAFDFGENPVPAFEMDNFTNFVKPASQSVKEVLTEVKMMRFYVNFIPKSSHILGGHVTLEVNGFQKFFTIYSQDTDTNLSANNPAFSGVFLYATNSIQ